MSVTPLDLLRIEAIKKYMAENPKETDCPVLTAVVFYLERGEEEQAKYKVMLDSDKFYNRKSVLKFLDNLGLLDDEYKARLTRWGTLE